MRKTDIPKRGYYYNKYPWGNRCTYCSGKTTGNKWIDLSSQTKWTGLMWWAMDVSEFKHAKYSTTNPTSIKM